MKQFGRIGMGLIGPGFIAPHHLDAVRRLGDVDVIAIAGSSAASAARKARQYGVARFYGDYRELIADPEIQVVHNTTPSYLHFPVTMAALEAGKHVISDKPLAMDPGQCLRLRDAAAAAGVVNAVTFNYRGNPLVQQARAMIASDAIGRIVFIHGHYLQDWMTSDQVYSWRSDPAKGGVSSALADIGSHWCDLAEHASGQRITAVLAELTTVVKTRYSAGGSAEAFASGDDKERTPVEVTSEDLASILLRFDNGARGCLTVGQVLPGHKNNLEVELNGRTGSLRWNQERQNELWIGRQDQPNMVMAKDPALLLPEAQGYAHLPGGHQEAWADAFRNVIADAYRAIREGIGCMPQPATLCTFADATHTSRVVDAMLRSHAKGGVWEAVEMDESDAGTKMKAEGMATA
ncbi:MAG TPA: Gfo/Idh/MocA family oxidoreductase [Granulicella sp.]|jgi:predicted dehydrogenase|nr:Gfo/Idh/MocA family oxidoreductase [Granulicella sp.]